MYICNKKAYMLFNIIHHILYTKASRSIIIKCKYIQGSKQLFQGALEHNIRAHVPHLIRGLGPISRNNQKFKFLDIP